MTITIDDSNNVLRWAVLLPPTSRSKLERMVEDRDAAYAAMRAADDRAFEAARDLESMTVSVSGKLSQMRQHGTSYADERERLEKPLVAKRTEVERLSAAHHRAEERWQNFAFLHDITDWLRHQRERGEMAQRTCFRHHPNRAVKATDAVAAVVKLRSDIDALDTEWEQISAAPAPARDLHARMVDAVERIAAHGAPRINALSREGDPANISRCLALTAHESGSFIGDGGGSFFVWLLKDEITARLGEMIDAAPQVGALTDAERADRFAEIAARRLELERHEEAIISAAAEKGQIIVRRREADPRAILEIEEA